ncbi:hypothetical protein [Halofilum ochraceum]|uniref:hypothetical protein n=1 Tax=Halofilum ochraceum TaxID=1611323 RepID=UPI0008D9F80E|nr:hypothetical protein [Halofilum ochraceum]
MMYIIVLVTLALLVVYLISRWLSAEAREAFAGGLQALRVRRGGRTPAMLIEETRAAFRAEGLEPDLIIVSHDALDLYDHLRREVIGRADRPDLPAATILALATDTRAGHLYLRAVDTPPGAPGRETATFHECAAVERIEPVANDAPAHLTGPGTEAIALTIQAGVLADYRLAVEPAWHLDPNDLTRRLRQIIQQGQRPDSAPVIVR